MTGQSTPAAEENQAAGGGGVPSSFWEIRSSASLALPVPVSILPLYLPLVFSSTVLAALSRP